MTTNLSADISIIFVCRLVFMLIFVIIILFVICISTNDSVKLGIIANRYLIFDLYDADVLIRICISRHG